MFVSRHLLREIYDNDNHEDNGGDFDREDNDDDKTDLKRVKRKSHNVTESTRSVLLQSADGDEHE